MCSIFKIRALILIVISVNLDKLNALQNSSESTTFIEITKNASISELESTINDSTWAQTSLSKVVRILSKQSDIIINYENKGGNFVDDFIKLSTKGKGPTNASNTRHSPVYFLVNYDSPLPLLKRAEDRNVVHIVYLSDPLKFSAYRRNFTQTGDIVIVLCVKLPNLSTCFNEAIDRDDSIRQLSTIVYDDILRIVDSFYVIEIFETNMNLYDVCFYCGDNSKQFILIINGTSDSNSEKLMTQHIALNSFKQSMVDFYGHRFRIAFVISNVGFECDHFTTVNKSKEMLTLCQDPSGVEGLFLTELSTKMNFTYDLVTPHREDHGYGPWKSLILNVATQKADWGIGYISVSTDRWKLVSFSKSFGNDPLRLMYSQPEDLWAAGLNVILIISAPCWLLLSGTIIALTVSVCISNRLFHRPRMVTYGDCFGMFLRVMLEQSTEGLELDYGRGFLATWLLCCIIITTTYKGKLSSQNIVNSKVDMTLDDLVNLGYHSYLNKDDPSVVQTLLGTSSDPILKKMSENTRSDLTICEAAVMLHQTKSMLVEEQGDLMYTFNHECVNDLSYDDLSRIRLTTNTFFESAHAWPFRKNGPFLPIFNQYISWGVQAGLFDKWTEQFTINAGRNFLKSDGSKESLEYNTNSIEAFFGPFLVLSIGLILSLLCFIVELLFFKYHNKKKMK